MAPAKSKAESIFSLSFRGGLPEILRAIAQQLEDQAVTAESFTSAVTKDRFELRIVVDLQK